MFYCFFKWAFLKKPEWVFLGCFFYNNPDYDAAKLLQEDINCIIITTNWMAW